jgi:putative transposase
VFFLLPRNGEDTTVLSSPDEESALKLVYLAIYEASKKWTMSIPKWREAPNHFMIIFEDRLPTVMRN